VCSPSSAARSWTPPPSWRRRPRWLRRLGREQVAVALRVVAQEVGE
jgi:hypothetical protein